MDSIKIEEKRIDIVKKWLKPKSVWDIQVFIGFVNFYQRFIKGFSRIVAPLIAMLKIIGSSVISASRVDDNKIVGDRGTIDGSNASRKLTMSKSWTKNEHLGNSNDLKEP